MRFFTFSREDKQEETPYQGDLLNFCNRKFSLRTTLMLVDQMLNRMEYMHSNNFIHRDIKPDIFLIGLDPTKTEVYIIDFGLSEKYEVVTTIPKKSRTTTTIPTTATTNRATTVTVSIYTTPKL